MLRQIGGDMEHCLTRTVAKALMVCGLVAAISACSTTPTNYPASTAGGSTTSPSSGPQQNVAADKALAQMAILKLSDFPAGWTSNPSQSSSSGDQQFGNDLDTCLHTSESILRTNGSPASADSPEFDDSNANTAESAVQYRASTANAQAVMKIVQQTNFPSCMTTAISKVITSAIQNPSTGSTLPAGASVGSVTFAAMSFPTYADASKAFRLTIPITYSGLTLSAYFDLILVEKGRVVVSMDFLGAGQPFDTAMEQQLTSLVVGRLTST